MRFSLLDEIVDGCSETIWPTRCAVCDLPGTVLCHRCLMNLPYIDLWRACPRCGAPWGAVQCTECNTMSLHRIGRESLPFASCVSTVMLSSETKQIVTVRKDGGEERLARHIAACMAKTIPPSWKNGKLTVTFIPASRKAMAKRGRDHMEPVAEELARLMGSRTTIALSRPARTRDQRALSRKGRFENMQGVFGKRNGANIAKRDFLLIDDVYTTGATLCAATDTLIEHGAGEVRCATFARAM